MASSPPLQSRDGFAALISLGHRALRAKWVGLGGLLVGLVITGGVAFTTHRVYRSEAVVSYDRGIANGPDTESSRQIGLRVQDLFFSRARLEELIKKNNLYPRIVDKRGIVEATEEMRSHIKFTLREGYTFRISFDGDDRDQTREILDQLVKSVVGDENQRRRRQADETKRFIDTERSHADDDVKATEAALGTFLAHHPQLASEAGPAPGGTLRAADRDRTEAGATDTSTLEVQAAQIEGAIARAASTSQAPSQSGQSRNVDPALVAAQTRAAAELRAAQSDLAEKQSRFTNDHPDVKSAVWHVREAESALHRAEAAVVASSTVAKEKAPKAAAAASDDSNGEVAGLRRALAATRAQIASVRNRATHRAEVPQDVKTIVAVDTEWTELSRAAAQARERQQQLESRQFQAQLAATLVAANQAGGLVTVDPPFRPMRPVAGGRSKVVMAGGVGSIVLALLAMFAAASLDRRIYSMNDVSQVVPTEIFVVVPRLEARKE